METIDELDPDSNSIDIDSLTKFLGEYDHTFMDRSKPKGPDYLIIDNLVENFDTIEKANLVNARGAAEALSENICSQVQSERCDYLIWLKDLDTNVEKMPALSQIYE